MQLMIDFSKLAALDAIKAEILTFLKDNMVESGTVFYEIQDFKSQARVAARSSACTTSWTRHQHSTHTRA